MGEDENNKGAINESVQKLLNVMGNESLPFYKIMRRLNLSHKPTFRKNYLLPALNLQLIEMTIPDKPKISQKNLIAHRSRQRPSQRPR